MLIKDEQDEFEAAETSDCIPATTAETDHDYGCLGDNFDNGWLGQLRTREAAL